jgi:putative DNA primase/helicase
MPGDLDDGFAFVFDNSEEIIARKAIRVDGGDLGPATKSAIDALAREPNPLSAIYVRGQRLVFPVRWKRRLDTGGIRRPDNALALRAVDRDVVGLRLTRVAIFQKTAKKGPPREVDPPERLCNTVLAASPWAGLPPLIGIIEAPTVLPNGRLIQRVGYDVESGLIFDPGATRFPNIPERPTREDARAALEFLQKPLEKFPFVDGAAKSVAIAAILTALVRRGLRAAPMICFSAPKPASGKTLLATLPSYIATGRIPYIMPPLDDPNEERKRLLATLSECPAVVLIDNVERAFRSSAMCIVLTEPTFSDRVLGSTDNRSSDTNVTFVCTGNNLVLAGDLSSRGIKCEIDPACEKPDARAFDLNLHEWVPANRGHLAAAALTIVMAYLAAGSPKPEVPNFARFEEWQSLCRYPLIWLGCADPCTTREGVAGVDPVQTQLKALLAAWYDCFDETPVTVKVACKSAHEGLLDAMESIANEKGGINVRRLGNFIARHERRIEGGLRFERAYVDGHAIRWKSVPIELRQREFRDFREFSPTPAGKENGNFKGNTAGENSHNSPNSPGDAVPNGIDHDPDEDDPFIPGGVDVPF